MEAKNPPEPVTRGSDGAMHYSEVNAIRLRLCGLRRPNTGFPPLAAETRNRGGEPTGSEDVALAERVNKIETTGAHVYCRASGEDEGVSTPAGAVKAGPPTAVPFGQP